MLRVSYSLKSFSNSNNRKQKEKENISSSVKFNGFIVPEISVKYAKNGDNVKFYLVSVPTTIDIYASHLEITVNDKDNSEKVIASSFYDGKSIAESINKISNKENSAKLDTDRSDIVPIVSLFDEGQYYSNKISPCEETLAKVEIDYKREDFAKLLKKNGSNKLYIMVKWNGQFVHKINIQGNDTSAADLLNPSNPNANVFTLSCIENFDIQDNILEIYISHELKESKSNRFIETFPYKYSLTDVELKKIFLETVSESASTILNLSLNKISDISTETSSLSIRLKVLHNSIVEKDADQITPLKKTKTFIKNKLSSSNAVHKVNDRSLSIGQIETVKLTDLFQDGYSIGESSSAHESDKNLNPRVAFPIVSPCDEDNIYWRYEYPFFSHKYDEKDCIEILSSIMNNSDDDEIKELKIDSSSNHSHSHSHSVQKVSRIPIEHPGMRNKKQKLQEAGDDSRVCWRGKFYPKELVITDEKAKEAMLIPRSSKLVVGQTLSDLTALAEIKYLKDGFFITGNRQDELPILVKEIASIGAGFVDRIYKIEVSTNNGLLLGSAVIKDKNDLRAVIGNEFYQKFLIPGSDEIDMSAAFDHIIGTRLDLKLLGAKDSKNNKTTKRGNYFKNFY
jgi:hypothetical protein